MADISFQGPQGPNVSFAVSAKTREQFSSVSVSAGQIVFLPNDRTIYFDGNYYGLSDADLTLLNGIQSRLTSVESHIGENDEAMSTLTQASNNMASILLSLKNLTGTQGANLPGQQSITQSIIDLDSALNGLQSRVNGLTTGVSSVNTQTGAVVLTGGDINMSSEDSTSLKDAIDARVIIQSGYQGSVSGVNSANLTGTQAIATAIENAHAAAVSANSNANDKIAKSTGTVTVGAQAVSNINVTALEDGEDIAEAIKTAIEELAGSSENWGNDEIQTLGKLRDLIKDVDDQVTALTGIQGDQADKIAKIIAELKQVSDDETGDYANTILDKLTVLLASSSTYDSTGTQDGSGYYKVGDSYLNTLQAIITALDSRISATESASGVSSLTGGQGITVTNNGVGAVTVNANAGAQTTAALVQNGDNHGATTAAGSTIQQALTDINSAAAGAHSAADAAQGTADQAITYLTWNVI